MITARKGNRIRLTPCLSFLFIMIRRILNLQSRTITFSAALIAFSVGVSALLGLLRDRLLAGEFGAGEELDIYFAAFRIPDMVYGILITGGIVAAFLPVFAETLERKKEEGWRLANNTLNFLLLLLLCLSVILFSFAPLIVKLIAPGFGPEQAEKTVLLTRIMMISPVLLGVSSVLSGMLQYFDRFLVYSLAPIMYNLGIIFGILFFVDMFGLVGLAYGVVLGSLMHLLIQVPIAFSCGYSYRPFIDLEQKDLRKVIRLVVPRIIGQSSTQINLIVITAIASTLTAGSVAIFNFADHLQAFPVRIVGVAFAVAAFPAFSRAIAMQKKEKFVEQFSAVVRQVLFFIIPLSVFIFFMRAEIVRLVLGTGEFGWQDTRLTAASLGIFAFGLFATSLIHILVRAFFSMQDTKTPLFASLFSMGLNIVLSFLFVWLLGFENILRDFAASVLKLQSIADIAVIAFPMALFVSGIVHFSLLLYFLKRKMGSLRGREIMNSFFATLVASLFVGIAAFTSRYTVDYFFELEEIFAQGQLLQLCVASVVSFCVYLIVARLMRSPEISAIYQSVFKR